MARALPKSPVPLWRPVKADQHVFFSDEEVARSKDYQRPIQYAKVAAGLIGVAEIVLLIGLHAAPRLLRATGAGNWVVQIVLLLAAFTVLDTIVSLPVTIFRYRHDKRWGFET